MLAYLIALLLSASAPAVVAAAELPLLTVKCLTPEGQAVCREMDDLAKKEVAAMQVDPRMLKFCAAKAEYQENGYFGLRTCIRHEVSAQKAKTLLIGIDDSGYCDRTSPDHRKPYAMAAFAACIAEQKEAVARLSQSLADYSDQQIRACVAKLKAEGLGSSLLLPCLNPG